MKDIILIDKPEGWTSFDVVAKIRGKIRAEYTACGEKPTKKQLRVGHAGTLDPFATGLIIILIGEACKKAGEFLKLDKMYEFTAKLGEVSTTGDPEGDITPFMTIGNMQKANSSQGSDGSVIPGSIGDPFSVSEQSESSSLSQGTENDVTVDTNNMSTLAIPTEEDIKNTLKQFEGVISQVPPAFSAIKINGQRAYKLAREGKLVEIPARQVNIYRLELIEYNYPYLKCVCEVSSGTYIRTLVEDIGKRLTTGAYCKQLRRTKIDEFKIEDSVKVEEVVK